MENTTAMFSLVEALVTWVLVVLGWLVVSDQQEMRELTKNVHSRLDKLRASLVETEEIAIAHHTMDFDEDRVRALVRRIGDISTEMAHLRRIGFVGIGTADGVASFRRAATGRNMDKSSYVRQSLQSEIIGIIAETRSIIDRELLAASHNALVRPQRLRDSVKSAVSRRL